MNDIENKTIKEEINEITANIIMLSDNFNNCLNNINERFDDLEKRIKILESQLTYQGIEH